MTFTNGHAEPAADETSSPPAAAASETLGAEEQEAIEKIVTAHGRLNECGHLFVDRAITLGSEFIRTKVLVAPRKEFMAFVAQNITPRTGLKHRQVNNYMVLADYALNHPKEIENLKSGTLQQALDSILRHAESRMNSHSAANSDGVTDDGEDNGDSEAGDEDEADEGGEGDTEVPSAKNTSKPSRKSSKNRGKERHSRIGSEADKNLSFWNRLKAAADDIQADKAPSLEGWVNTHKLQELLSYADVIGTYLKGIQEKVLAGEATGD